MARRTACLSARIVLRISSGASSVRVEVRDDGSDRTPAPGRPDASAEDGRGLSLVELIADQWGQVGDWRGRSVFFGLRWKESD